MRIDEFNALSQQDAIALLLTCAAVPSWAEQLAARRPYRSAEALRSVATAASLEWMDADLGEALSHHPRIGERAQGSGAEAESSRREQAAMALAGGDVARQIAAANTAYEERFGRVFLIRAAGRSAEEMLSEAQRRLENDPDIETAETLGQLREITVLRLGAAIEDTKDEGSRP